MKNNIFLILFVIHCQCVIGQEYIRLNDGSFVTGDHYSTMPKRIIKNVDGGIFVSYTFEYASLSSDDLFPSSSVLFFDGFEIGDKPEKPALPVRWDRFLLPSENYYSISIIDSSYIEIPIEIAPSRPALGNGSHFVYTIDNVPRIKPYDGVFPQNTIDAMVNKYRSHPILDICMSPVRYDYQLKRVKICKNISFIINTGLRNNNISINSMDYETDPLLFNIVMNPRTESDDKNQRTSAELIPIPKYEIITTPKFLEAVNKLADWKRTKGYDVKILSKTSWTETSIKDSILASNQISPISYLLLFGDFQDVPGKMSTRIIKTTEGDKTYNFSTDYYYGCIRQNAYPDIRRGRISASSLSEAFTIVDKIIQYERTPTADSSFYHKGINCSYFQDENYYDKNGNLIEPRNGYEDRRYTLTSEEIRDHLIQQGKTINRVYKAEGNVNPRYWKHGGYGQMNTTPIPNELLRDSGYLWNGNYQDIINGINEGAFYVLHRDHGNINYWGDPYFNKNHINQLTNGNKLPIVFSMNCLTGRYNGNTCFAETFLRKSQGGCVGIIAATETSLTGYNDALMLGMFEAIWPFPSFIKPFPSDTTVISFTNIPVYRLGDILDLGLSEIQSIYPGASNSYISFTKEIFHYFGDPAMEIYTDVPTPFENVTVAKENGCLVVSVGEDATITFYNKLTGTIESFCGSHITYPDDDNIRLCISAHNKIPYVKEMDSIYIQNETIAETRTYNAYQIKVGSNVTTQKPEGQVVITNGKTLLIGNSVELYGETIVELGAELEIRN